VGAWYCSVSAQVFVSTDKPIYKPGDLIFAHTYLIAVDTKLPLLLDSVGEPLYAPAVATLSDKDR
jgi:hypothetical protein